MLDIPAHSAERCDSVMPFFYCEEADSLPVRRVGFSEADSCGYLALQSLQKSHCGGCMDCIDNGGGYCTQVRFYALR
jgi:hypothetical protein